MCWLLKLRLAGRSNTLYRRMMKLATWIPGRKIVPNVLIKNSEVGWQLFVIMHVCPLLPNDSQNQEEVCSASSFLDTRSRCDCAFFFFFFFFVGGLQRFMILCHDRHIISCSIQLVCRGIIYVYYPAERVIILSILESGHQRHCLSDFYVACVCLASKKVFWLKFCSDGQTDKKSGFPLKGE